MKTLKQIRELYKPQTKDGQKFVDKHVVKKTPDANKNDDKLFNASNVKSVSRQPKHGYNPGEDEKVYEETNQLDEFKRFIPSGSGFDPDHADLPKLERKYGVTIKQHPFKDGAHVIGPEENVKRFHRDTTEYNKEQTVYDMDRNQLDEVAPKGWKKTVERMKKHKEVDNPFALAYWMKKKGYKSRFKESLDSDVSEANMNQKDLDQMIQNVKNKSLPPSAKSNPTTKLDRMIQNVDRAYKASKQQKKSGVLKIENHSDEGQQLDEIGFNAGEVWKSQMSTPKASASKPASTPAKFKPAPITSAPASATVLPKPAASKATKPVSNPFARNSGMGYSSNPQTMSPASPSANRSLRQQQLRSYSTATQKPAPITSAPASAIVLPKSKTTGYTEPLKQKATPLSPPAIASAAPAPKMEKPIPLADPTKASIRNSVQKTAGTVAAAKPKPKTSDANLVPGKRGDTFKTASQVHRTTGPGNVPGRKTGTINFKPTTNTPPKTPGYFEKQGAPVGGSQRAIAQAQKDAETQAYQAAQDSAAERRSKIFAKFKNAFTIKQPSRMGESKIEDINELDDAAGGYPVVTDSSKIRKPKPEPKIASATPPLNPMVKKPRIHSSYAPGKKPVHHIILPNEKKI